jgi:hypothetical protein
VLKGQFFKGPAKRYKTFLANIIGSVQPYVERYWTSIAECLAGEGEYLLDCVRV